MYRVVLVDDDRLVTKFLEKMIPWEEHGFKIIASFQDSREAYEYLNAHPYDVLLTDIGMPQMNGIELISKVKQPSSYYVILSCHDEFNFAKQALKLDVYDYLLKETMEEEDIVELLMRLKTTLDESKEQKTYQDKLKHFLKQNNMVLKTKFLENIINNAYFKRDKWWKEQEDLLGMNFSTNNYTVALCYIDQFTEAVSHYKTELLLHYSINNILEEVLLNNQQDIEIFYLQEKFFILFPARSKSEMTMQTIVYDALRELQRKLSSYLKLSITVLINEGNHKHAELAKIMQKLLNNDEQRFYFPYGSIQIFHSIDYNQDYIFQSFADDLESLKKIILHKDESKLKQFIEDKMITVQEKKFAPKVVRDWAIKLILDIKVSLNAFHQFEDQSFNAITDLLLDVENFQEMSAMLEKVSLEFMEKVSNIKATSQNETIFKAQKYVLSHLDKKITLKEISDVLHFNPSYFSRMYKKETGENFIEYVTRIKMEKAKEQLKYTRKSVEQISLELGFNSKSYFITTFKKNSGISPQSYKYDHVL